jgi:hypothetical protein
MSVRSGASALVATQQHHGLATLRALLAVHLSFACFAPAGNADQPRSRPIKRCVFLLSTTTAIKPHHRPPSRKICSPYILDVVPSLTDHNTSPSCCCCAVSTHVFFFRHQRCRLVESRRASTTPKLTGARVSGGARGAKGINP